MKLMRSIALGLGVTAVTFGALASARGEGEEGMDEVSAKVKAQMEKIIRLMHENEEALLRISTGKQAKKPEPVDVKPPEVPPRPGGSTDSGTEGTEGTDPSHPGGGTGTSPSGTAPSGTPPSGTSPSGAGAPGAGPSPSGGGETHPGAGPGPSGGQAPEGGADAARSMEDLIRESRKTSGEIPREMEQLVRMVPYSRSGSSPDPQDPSAEPKPDPRDIRKSMDDKPDAGGEKKPEDGRPDHPRDPKDRDPAQPKPPGSGEPPPKDDRPVWDPKLPPQIRDAYVRGAMEKIPPEYQELIKEYLQWLGRAASESHGR